MPDISPAPELQIAMSFLHDGRVGLALKQGWYHTHDLRMTTVDDVTATAGIVLEWASRPLGEPGPTSKSYAAFPELHDAYLVVLGARPDSELRRFTEYADALCGGFALAFAPGRSPEPGAKADRFATELARAMRNFVARSKRKATTRLAGGAYLPVLESHLATLRSVRAVEDQSYYEQLKWGIGGIMADEQYLLLADEPESRALYAAIRAEEASLYNWYMDLAKGGIKRPR